MTNTKKAISILAALLVAGGAYAADEQKATEGSSKVKASELKKEKKEDIDKEITNARLRATTGSKKKYSLSTSLAYSGGTIKNPLSATAPNIYGTPQEDPRTGIGGSISGRYRLDKRQSVTAGIGFSYSTPFHGQVAVKNEVTGEDVKYDQFEITNPSLGYSYAAKMGRFQTFTSAGLTIGTTDVWKQNGIGYSVSAGFTGLTSVGETGLTVGSALSVSHRIYKRSVNDGEYTEGLGIYPFAEYSLSDSVSLRTVIGVLNFYRLRGVESDLPMDLLQSNNYQSVGVGFSVTRDIYLYPNLQFNPDDFDPELTNVGVSATINL